MTRYSPLYQDFLSIELGLLLIFKIMSTVRGPLNLSYNLKNMEEALAIAIAVSF